MLRREQLYLLDILSSCQKIQAYASAIDKDEFTKHNLPFDGIIRHLGIIGEAVRNLSPETRALAPDIGWSDIVRLRNIVIHRYFGLDDETLWESSRTMFLTSNARLRRSWRELKLTSSNIRSRSSARFATAQKP